MGVEVRPKGLVERMEETLPAQVAIRRVRTPPAESLRFPEQGQSAQGKSGPKPRPKGVGERTDRSIFLHRLERVLSDGATGKDKHTDHWTCRVAVVGGSPRKIREIITPRTVREAGFGWPNLLTPCLQEKPLASVPGARTANRHR